MPYNFMGDLYKREIVDKLQKMGYNVKCFLQRIDSSLFCRRVLRFHLQSIALQCRGRSSLEETYYKYV